MTATDDFSIEYRYFTTDILSNQVLAEIPFKGVSYERSIRTAGTFSGTIPVIPETLGMNLYDSTMPGKTALYVMRNDVCVWGGIIWTRDYDVVSRILSVEASEFTSYLYRRVIWKTWTHDLSATCTASSNVVSFTLQSGSSYPFVANSIARVIFSSIEKFKFNGYYTVLSSPTPTSNTFSVTIPGYPNSVDDDQELASIYVRSDTYDYTRQLLALLNVDFSSITFPNDEIEPSSEFFEYITNISRTSAVATATTQNSHGLIPGQVVEIANIGGTFDGVKTVINTPTANTFTYSSGGANTSTALTVSTANVSTRSLVGNTVTFSGNVTISTTTSHGFDPGDFVTVSGVDSVVDGTHVISATTANTFSYEIISADSIPETAITGGTAAVGPYVIYNSYGPFLNQSDVDIDISTNAYSGKGVENKNSRGYELETVGDLLEQYSNTVDGFEYRIDCTYDPVTSSFKRTFVLMPIDFPDPPAPGEVSDPSRFGADEIVFEYPGNIMSANMEESAREAATRFWVLGDIGDLGDEASQPYSAASAVDLLAAGWPLLEDTEKTKETGDEDTLAAYAEQYLNESRPPNSNFEITVNGSLQPVVGSYDPGDWCSIIFTDEFVNLRLASDLEIRDDVIIRKSDSFSVSVPDSPSFPETVSLTLVTEPQVDKVGD